MPFMENVNDIIPAMGKMYQRAVAQRLNSDQGVGEKDTGCRRTVAGGNTTARRTPPTASRLPVFSRLPIVGVESVGVRRSPSPADCTTDENPEPLRLRHVPQ